jgi:GMP synthase (glutamine-hydrolysing)
MPIRLLIIEGNARDARAAQRAANGRIASEAYADALVALAPDARCEICLGADGGAPAPLESYDGAVMTGSSLNLYDGGDVVTRQIDLARALFAARVPFFGSCWGLQVASAAAGGDVIRNPLGREIGFARNIALNESGRAHPMLAGRPAAFDAPCSHIDIVVPPASAVTLAANAMSAVQAAEISHAGGKFWGVQYHPEYSLIEIASIIARRADALVDEGFFSAVGDAQAYAEDLRTLEANPRRRDIAFRLGIGRDVLDIAARRTELRNFIDAWVRPEKSRRGRT